jgi:hypothetical protein
MVFLAKYVLNFCKNRNDYFNKMSCVFDWIIYRIIQQCRLMVSLETIWPHHIFHHTAHTKWSLERRQTVLSLRYKLNFKYNSEQFVFKQFTVNTEDRDELGTCSTGVYCLERSTCAYLENILWTMLSFQVNWKSLQAFYVQSHNHTLCI